MSDQAPEDLAFLKDLVKQVMAESQEGGAPPPAPVTAPPAPTKFKMNVLGKEMEFDTPEEASNTVNEAFRMYTNQQEKLNPPAKPPVASDEAPDWDQTEFEQKMTANPYEGFKYAVKKVSGLDRQTVQLLASEVVRLRQDMAMRDFQSANQDLTPAMPQLQPIVENVRQKYNMPMNANGYKAALLMAQQEGLVPQFTPAEKAPPVAQAPAPPPNVSRGGDNTTEVWEEQVEAMNENQLVAYRDKLLREMQRR